LVLTEVRREDLEGMEATEEGQGHSLDAVAAMAVREARVGIAIRPEPAATAEMGVKAVSLHPGRPERE
jgi:hypothetical protein